MSVLLMKELLEVGARQHQAKRWNPKMKPYLCRKKWVTYLRFTTNFNFNRKVYEFVREISSQGGKVLFVGTKNKLKMLLKMKL